MGSAAMGLFFALLLPAAWGAERDVRDFPALEGARLSATLLRPPPAHTAPSHPKRPLRKPWSFLIAWFGGSLTTLWILYVVMSAWSRGRSPRKADGVLVRAPGPRPAPRHFEERYEIRRVAGSGGMGVVYEALDRNLLRRVAVKKMRGEIREDPAARERLLAEARTVASLHHPNIVEIYSVEEDRRDLYLVFEYLEATTLHDAIQRRGRLPFPDALRLFRGICGGLDFAHRHGVIHRDLKPLNIMVCRDGAPKIMDFGFARCLPPAAGEVVSKAYGTRRYMAPEQELGVVRPESDLYALGVTLYEALSARYPFAHGRDKLAPPEPLSRAAPGLPAGIDSFLARALHPDPARRWRSAREFHAALTALSIP